MNAVQKITNIPLPIISKLDKDWLLNKPWLWETRIHQVLAYTLSLNFFILLMSAVTEMYTGLTIMAAVFSLLGFGYWIYNLWQFSVEQDRGKAGDHIAQKRFGIYFLSVLLFTTPACIPEVFSLAEALYTPSASDMAAAGFGVIASAAMVAILIQIWKQIHTKLFIMTIVSNALVFVGFALLISISSFFVVLLVALVIFSFPMLISLITDVPKIKKFNSWKVVALASIQFYAPFLLSFVIGLFMIPFSQLFSGFVFLIGLGIAAFSYIAYVLPTFRQMHIHMQALPR